MISAPIRSATSTAISLLPTAVGPTMKSIGLLSTAGPLSFKRIARTARCCLQLHLYRRCCPEHFHADFGHARLDHRELAGGCEAEVEHPAFDVRAAVIDPHHRGAVIGEIGHTDIGSQRQTAMGGSHAARSVRL